MLSSKGSDDFQSKRLAVKIFDNYTLDSEYDIIGKMAADRITQGLIKTDQAQVVSFNSMNRFKQMQDQNPTASLHEITNADYVVSGNYTVNGSDELQFEGYIEDALTGDVLQRSEFHISCPSDNPMEGIEKIKATYYGHLGLQGRTIYSHPQPLRPTMNIFKPRNITILTRIRHSSISIQLFRKIRIFLMRYP